MNRDVRLGHGRHHMLQALFTIGFVACATAGAWAQFVVTTLADTGPGSLRQAITDANADTSANTITFGLSGVILLANPLPTLTGTGDTIDGTGAAIVIDGTNTPTSPATVGLRVRRRDVTIRGLTIQNFPGDGIRVEATANTQNVNLASVTDVLIEGNLLLANRGRGIRITGGQRDNATVLAHIVSASIVNNTVTDSGIQGIAVYGNLLDSPAVDIGGNQVTVLVDGNTVKNSNNNQAPAGLGGDGIIVSGGPGAGSNNVLNAIISNNTILNNRDDGIVAVGCGVEDTGSNNRVNVSIISNRIQGSGTDGSFQRSGGIAVSGASGEQGTVTTCAGNVMRFDVSGNVVTQNRTGGISISGGTGTGHDLQGVVSGNSAKDTPEGRGITISGGGGTGNNLHDITVSGNQVSGNRDGGIIVTGGTDSVNNVIDGLDILLNNIRSNGGQGLLITGGTNSTNATISDVLIDGNTANGNGSRGIHVTSGTTAINPVVSLAGVTNNTTNSNTDDGLFIGTGIPGVSTPVAGNRADRNGVDGIDLESTGYALSNNTASRNAGAGIDAVGNVNGGGNKATQNSSCNTPGCF